MSVEAKLQDSLVHQLQDRAMLTVSRLARLCQQNSSVGEELRRKFLDAVSDIERVQIGELGPDNGSFFVKAGILHVSEAPVAELMAAVVDDVRRRQATSDKEPVVDLFDLFDDVFAGFVLHELRHRTQGVEEYPLVAAIRAAGGPMAMAEIDAVADRDAAYALAALKVEGGDRAAFLRSFEEALFLSSAYYFRVFPVTTARPDKIARALGVLLMLARLAALRPAQLLLEDQRFPLDAPLFVHLRSDYGSLTIWRGEPQRTLLAHCNDAEAIAELAQEVERGCFDQAVEIAVRLLRALKLVK